MTDDCNCEQSLRLARELRVEQELCAFEHELAGIFTAQAQRFRAQLYRRRLEVLELRLRNRVIESRYTVWSTIPEIRDAQERRRDRNRERLCAVQALREYYR